MSYDKPTVQDFKDHFDRDFPYAPYIPDPIDPVNNPPTQDPAVGVTDKDIQRAMLEAEACLNEAICPSQAAYTLWYLYLTAHFLVMDLRAAAQGIEGNYSWITSSKSVGNVAEGFTVPQKILDNPVLGMFSKTNYGAKYLNMVLPYLAGAFYVIPGATLP